MSDTLSAAAPVGGNSTTQPQTIQSSPAPAPAPPQQTQAPTAPQDSVQTSAPENNQGSRTVNSIVSNIQGAGSTPSTMRRGSSGDNVKQLQQRLNQMGAHLQVDGRYGPLTQGAVRTMQKSDHLQTDGIAGRKTLGALGLEGQPSTSPVQSGPNGHPQGPNGTHGPQGTQGTSSPSGQIRNPTDFAKALLQKMGAPATDANVKSLSRWATREGGNWHNSAHFNPLCTTQRMPGSHSMNHVGVQAYQNWNQGLDATAKTLNNGGYNDIVSALMGGGGLGHGFHPGLYRWSGHSYGSI